ncbi:YqiA/YcfP family alpha/beta fold hydrolase [Hugenholtzia roseola]|uniref:YqiA/YcfP family alpha/beta fold hydrolase n=1 Tax=Hugenholtzia roseola TaxID=1002 RepID=UPI00040952DA|nr:YqiA/YcfP family alpha/beta fold hydrolase [Hugenholtzia roseola]
MTPLSKPCQVLYIHGLDANPSAEKVEILKQYFGEQVFAPQLAYRQNLNTFQDLKSFLEEKMKNNPVPTFIVGSSAGGLMGYWLAKHLGLSALLFNPALAYLSVFQTIDKEIKQILPFWVYLVIGEQDEVITPDSTYDFLQNNENPAYYTIKKIENLGHRIDIETFEKSVKNFISNLKY